MENQIQMKRRGRPRRDDSARPAAVEPNVTIVAAVEEAARLTAQVAQMDAKRETLSSRLSDAEKAVSAAREARRQHALQSGHDVDMRELSRSVRDAEEDVDLFKEALSDLEAQRAAVASDLARVELIAPREERALKFESIASDIETTAADLDEKVGELAEAFARLEAAIPEAFDLVDIGCFPDRARRARSARSAGAILAEALYRAVPQAFADEGRSSALHRLFSMQSPSPGLENYGARVPALDARSASETLLGNRARAHAEALRRGDVHLDAGWREPRVEKLYPLGKSFDEVQVFAVANFRYIVSEGGRTSLCGANWVHNVPGPVAEVAAARGYAVLMSTPEGEKALAKEKAYRETRGRSGGQLLSAEDCTDLGDPCGFQQVEELDEAA